MAPIPFPRIMRMFLIQECVGKMHVGISQEKRYALITSPRIPTHSLHRTKIYSRILVRYTPILIIRLGLPCLWQPLNLQINIRAL
jgi:hypothetical protein